MGIMTFGGDGNDERSILGFCQPPWRNEGEVLAGAEEEVQLDAACRVGIHTGVRPAESHWHGEDAAFT